MKTRWKPLVLAALMWMGFLLPGCADLSYYVQSIHGHFSVLHAARPIASVVEDPSTPAALKNRLAKLQDIRNFASRHLALPDNQSYRRYADLGRPFVVWNVFATPELSLRLKQWCFPVVGCVAYRGYYHKADAEAMAAQLREEGWDVSVGGVSAYSSLGYFDDPVLNTFISYPEGELARLVFHELAHQVVYAKDDTAFNESFATALEEYGVERWLAEPRNAAHRAPYERFAARRADFVALLKAHRQALQDNYAQSDSDEVKRQRKADIFARLQADYRRLKAERWDGYSGYDRWFEQALTNAHLAAIATYTEWVPAFRALLDAHEGHLPAFYTAVKAWADQTPSVRRQTLVSYAQAGSKACLQASDSAATCH